MSYTFLCTGCITGTSSSFSGSTADISLGFAVGTKSPTNPTSASSATFVYHDGGFGGFVAGAGPAGIIVAQRLTESGKSVLLLEGGKASTYATGGRSTVSWNDTVTQYDVPSMSYYLTTASDTSEYCTDTASRMYSFPSF
ncbi:putative Cellobiose dehydrogenase [Glarea lozoyensis 74030]|uniref:Putative Cellobiose dehydrogenase n=1 Tax=Glarea lozoyensis (strain ATCC 74030 / MF5533) TaxID=1104152 RepID=H0EF29_GLAL7|nr:putative Cellobiose dehydrogenase [Glarea lozoyensis 74030]